MRFLSSRTTSVLILGANGRLGCAVANAFASAGWTVFAQVRRDPSPLLPPGAHVLRIDLSDPGAIVGAAAGVGTVVHAVNPPYPLWRTEALPALRAGLDVATRLKARFMLPGNVYNFGRSMPAVLREQTLALPSTRKGQIRVDMEALIGQHALSRGLPADVIRAGDFFGFGTGSWLDKVIVKSLRSGALVYPGPMDAAHAWAYLPDLARAFVCVATKCPQTPGLEVWNFPGYTLTGNALLEAIEKAADELGLQPVRPYHRREFPWRLIRFGGLVVPLWQELAEMDYLWRVPHGLEGCRLAALDDEQHHATPLAVALKTALQSLGFGALLPATANST